MNVEAEQSQVRTQSDGALARGCDMRLRWQPPRPTAAVIDRHARGLAHEARAYAAGDLDISKKACLAVFTSLPPDHRGRAGLRETGSCPANDPLARGIPPMPLRCRMGIGDTPAICFRFLLAARTATCSRLLPTPSTKTWRVLGQETRGACTNRRRCTWICTPPKNMRVHYFAKSVHFPAHRKARGFSRAFFVMPAIGVFFKRTPDLDEEKLFDVSNLCCSTGYATVIKAVRAGASAMKARGA